MQHQRIQERRIEAAKQVTESWHDLETAYHIMMSKMGQAMSSIASAHLTRGACFPLEAGMGASKQIAAAAVNMADGYADIVAGHRMLGEDRDRLRIRADGDAWPTPQFETEEPVTASPATRHLRVA
jgi:hypothetical protein